MNTLQHQPPSLLTPEPPIAVNRVTPTPPSDPVVRKQVVQDLMAQMQGTYNFMQVNYHPGTCSFTHQVAQSVLICKCKNVDVFFFLFEAPGRKMCVFESLTYPTGIFI